MNREFLPATLPLLISLIILMWHPSARAETFEPFVETSVKPDSVQVGDSLTLEVIILVPTWFAGTPVFPSFELTNTITRLPPDSAFPTSRRINGETWSGIVRHYQITPLVAADFELRDQTIKVSWANPGKPPFNAIVQVPDVTYQATVPAGAERLNPFVAGTSFTLNQDLNAPETLAPGDAVVLTLTAELKGLPAIFIPELLPTETLASDSIRAYPSEPVLEGNLRTERVTLVLDKPGQITIPARQIEWWNTDSQAIERAETKPITLNVTGSIPAPEVVGPKPSEQHRSTLLLSIATLLLGLLLGVALRHWYLKRPSNPEKAAYHQAIKAVRRRAPADAYRGIVKWLEALPVDLREDPHSSDNQISIELNRLRRHLYAGDALNVDFNRLAYGLKAMRKQYLKTNVQEINGLPALNP